MPRIPTAQDLGSSPTPSVRRGVVPISIEVPRLGYEGRALEELGRAVGEVGNEFYQAAVREKQRVGTIKVEERFNAYSNALLDMETEYSSIKGGNVQKQDMYKSYAEKRKELAEKLAKDLDDVELAAAFTKRVMVADRLFDAGLYRHVAKETAEYEDQTDLDTVGVEIRRGTLAWDRPGELDTSVLRISEAAKRMAARKGMPVENLRTGFLSQLHNNVINTMLEKGNDLAAKVYYNKVKEDLTDKAVVELSTKLEVSHTDEEAMRSTSEIWSKFAPDAFGVTRSFDMEEEARRRHKGNPKLVQSVINQLRSMAQGWEYQQREERAVSKVKMLDAYAKGATLAEIQRMPEYAAHPDREQIRQYVLESGYTEQQRAAAEAARTEGIKAEMNFGRYWDLSKPSVLSRMSENEIKALVPEMGRELVGKLMIQKRAMSDPKDVREASIDSDQFNVLADSAGLKPYDKSPTPEHKGRLGRLKASVESAIDQAQRATGRELNRDEKGALMQKEIDRWVMVNEWGRDPKLPAATVKPDQFSDVYVPINDIPPSVVQNYVNMMMSIGAAPQNLSSSQVKALHKKRIEKAYGIYRAGGSNEQIENALKGK